MTPMTTHHEVPGKVEDRLIVALDVPSISEARALIDTVLCSKRHHKHI
jgi:hypothetical protein